MLTAPLPTAAASRPAAPHDAGAGRATGAIAVANAGLVVAGFAALAVAFEFPDVLDRPAAAVLPLFAENEGAVVGAYTVLTMTGVLFAVLAVGLHRVLSGPRTAFLAGFTVLGVLAGLAQAVGFARWPFLVPALSDAWATAGADRAAVAQVYDAFNAYAGGAIGEHLGWVLQSAWGVGVAVALERSGVVRPVLARAGVVLAALFGLLTYAAMLAPGAEAVQGPVYTAWVLWTALVGLALVRR